MPLQLERNLTKVVQIPPKEGIQNIVHRNSSDRFISSLNDGFKAPGISERRGF